MTDDEYLEAVREYRKETVELYKPSNRHVGEIWIANEFLKNLGIPFDEYEFEHVKDDPPDVIFRTAQFEIKRILDSGRKPDKEHKESLKKAMEAETPQDLIEHYSLRDIEYTEIYKLVEKDVIKYSSKYSADVKKSMDILFYVNLWDTRAYIAGPLPLGSEFEKHGFRSISFVSGPLSGVLMANDDAPEFIGDEGVRVVRKNSGNERTEECTI
jgi:hypothetical protein